VRLENTHVCFSVDDCLHIRAVLGFQQLQLFVRQHRRVPSLGMDSILRLSRVHAKIVLVGVAHAGAPLECEYPLLLAMEVFCALHIVAVLLEEAVLAAVCRLRAFFVFTPLDQVFKRC